ncbi:MAG: hypothetical protein CVU08_12610 [Bacteroidetes bacterium HGW-Bacteroidetes-3]|nr:MAG: hypothetical protein CVU08_12610 [Bacteroidetes bacterium HGW-Bacteroidetes-3]
MLEVQIRTILLKYIAYVSQQTHILTDLDIKNLLEICRKNNLQNKISGMLIYFDGTFVQFLEGSEERIDILFSKIENDKRHQKIVLLLEGFSEKREFSEWSMAYKHLKLQETIKIIGQKDFKKEDLFKGKNPESEHPGIALLKSFVNDLHL